MDFEIIINYDGGCPNCGDKSDWELIDEYGEAQWIRCRYCKDSFCIEDGEIVIE